MKINTELAGLPRRACCSSCYLTHPAIDKKNTPGSLLAAFMTKLKIEASFSRMVMIFG
jgi:hypothetical protein